MNVLPKSEIKFAEKDYWDGFFKNKDNKDFEWYGEYPELCSHLHKYIKPKDNILVVGCGNSQLSANMYDVGYRNIANIDVSTVVVKQMKLQNIERTTMSFEVMDALNMSLDNDSFSVVLDKGTLDALMPQDTESDVARGKGLLSEVARVLKLGGRYVVVSLLQPHILRTLLEECCSRGWMVRVCRCQEVEERTLKEFGRLRMPVFMVICTKFRKIGSTASVLELSLGTGDKPLRADSPEEVLVKVKEVQQAMAMCSAIQKQALQEEVEMEFRRDGDASPRYTIRVVDSGQDAARLRGYGALIVPHGRETEWMFGTTTGRQLLRKSSGFERLAVVSLHRDHKYPSMDEIQRELSSSVMQLAPHGAASNIPYVTVGDGLGSRETVHNGTSQLSGDFVVEDVSVDQDRFRRLVFLSNQSVIQSEARLKKVAGKKGTTRWAVDTSHVACAHHCYMGVALAMQAAAGCSVLVLGLGGGGLCSFLNRVFPHAATTAVDIDPAIVDVAKKFFDVTESERLHLEVADGLEYLGRCRTSCTTFNVVMVDVDAKSSDAMSCPPPQFVSDVTLDNVAAVLGESGIFVLNIVCRIESVKAEVVDRIRKRFRLVARYSLEEDVNEIVYASCREDLTQSAWKDALQAAAVSINKLSRKKLARKDDLVDVTHIFKSLSVTS